MNKWLDDAVKKTESCRDIAVSSWIFRAFYLGPHWKSKFYGENIFFKIFKKATTTSFVKGNSIYILGKCKHKLKCIAKYIFFYPSLIYFNCQKESCKF